MYNPAAIDEFCTWKHPVGFLTLPGMLEWYDTIKLML